MNSRRVALIAAVVLTACAVAVVGFSVGRSSGPDLDRARRDGEARGAAAGRREGKIEGERQGRAAGYAQTYKPTYDIAFANANVTPVTTTTTQPVPLSEPIAAQTGARGLRIQVPVDWRLQADDGSGPGSVSTWTDPFDASRKVVVRTGVATGGWYEVDGVAGSIDPSLMLPSGAQITSSSATRYNYRVAGTSPVVGVWIADFDPDGSACCYRQAEVSTTQVSEDLARRIIASF